MRRRRAYRATSVKNVLLRKVLAAALAGAVTAGIDVGKHEIYVVLRWADGTFERPWKVKSPVEIFLLVRLLTALAKEHPLKVAMESTGTYGEPLRQALTDAELDVHCVSGKATHDYAEIFDGVPSQHDGKDAAIVAELAALGKSRPWPYQPKTNDDAEMAYWVDWLDAQQGIQMLWIGRMEALLARHWPELTSLLDLTSVTLMEALIHYGGPAKLAADDDAAKRLRRWGRAGLKDKKIEKVIQSATHTAGVRQNRHDILRVQQYAAMALAAYRETQKAGNNLKSLAAGNDIIQRQGKAVGVITACVLWVALGDPRNYYCAAAYRKAMGLNLKERSSGKYQGRLKITKRGPAVVRRWLYFAAMRTAQKPEVRPWYEAKKAKDGDRAMGALIGIARKLALALYSVGVRDEPFQAWRLFPGHSVSRKMLQAHETLRAQICNAGLSGN
jgi:transposase